MVFDTSASCTAGLSGLQQQVLALAGSISRSGKAAPSTPVPLWANKGLMLKPVGTGDKRAIIEGASRMLNTMDNKYFDLEKCIDRNDLEGLKLVAQQLQSSGSMYLSGEQKDLLPTNIAACLDSLVEGCNQKISDLESKRGSQGVDVGVKFMYQSLANDAAEVKASMAAIPGLVEYCCLTPIESSQKPLLSGVLLDPRSGLPITSGVTAANEVHIAPDPTPSAGAAADVCRAK